jgi:hypothetical protein
VAIQEKVALGVWGLFLTSFSGNSAAKFSKEVVRMHSCPFVSDRDSPGFQYYPSYLRLLEERLNRRSVFRELRWSVSVERGEKWKHPRDWQCAFAASCKNGISFDELHRCLRTTPSKHCRVILKKTLVATVVALLFLLSSEAILAVQRPPYPIKAEPPDAGRWVIISTNEKLR